LPEINKMKRFENKVVVVTGAASGIGKAVAKKFALEGAILALADVGDFEPVKSEILFPEKHLYISCNIASRTDVDNLIKTTVSKFGKLDFAVNCAGIAGKVSMPVHEYPEEAWLEQIQVNLIGTWYCVKFQIEQMLKNGGGNIVCVTSAAGLIGQPENSAYSASKHGVEGLMKSVAIEYATKNIRINSICPTAIETPMIMHGRRKLAENEEARQQAVNFQRMKRMGRPEEIADIALWLCSDESSFITGSSIKADGGALC
jgi:NAD(P)-dependent dehydrogenase (short-subunit alcohol dehydrogenase family)